MPSTTLARILAHLSPLEVRLPVDPAAVVITGVTGDSRQVAPGALFVASLGGSVDGHRFIADALRRGAGAVMGSRPITDLPSLSADSPYICVAHPRLALATAAAALHDFPSRNLITIGITGTDGKTTTATILESILAQVGRVGVITTVGARIRGEEQDTGFHVTTPDAPVIQAFLAQMRTAECRYAIIESTSHGLDQERVAAIDFDVAAVTNITHEHLDYHGSRDAYVAAKARLFRMLFAAPAKPAVPRLAVLNADDPGSYAALRAAVNDARAASATSVALSSYGFARDGDDSPDVAAGDIRYQPDQTTLVIRWSGADFPLSTTLIGDYNVQNILCAVTVALGLGVAPGAIQAGVRALPGVIGRMERMDGGQDFLAIVDFAHSPASLERALTTLRMLVTLHADGSPGRLIAVFGSAGLRDRAKRRLMGRVSGRLADFTVITAEDPRTEDLAAINAEIAAGVEEHASADGFVIVPDRAEAIQYAVAMAQKGDVVCAFGKGHERSMCFGETEYPWSDQQAMMDALNRLCHVAS
ncbi:MAG: UDP-N-acetylmuramoyl-L-alanyl-D-glutamate--2,6-diaminopimelate ligase [Caldilineaceae bacterium]|nr:UDP-N-acetylmuramoyl-L-alanyl-D-glutamate--2,6-diaminopimelate ligase [Caldilineaceae bacterium]